MVDKGYTNLILVFPCMLLPSIRYSAYRHPHPRSKYDHFLLLQKLDGPKQIEQEVIVSVDKASSLANTTEFVIKQKDCQKYNCLFYKNT